MSEIIEVDILTLRAVNTWRTNPGISWPEAFSRAATALGLPPSDDMPDLVNIEKCSRAFPSLRGHIVSSDDGPKPAK